MDELEKLFSGDFKIDDNYDFNQPPKPIFKSMGQTSREVFEEKGINDLREIIMAAQSRSGEGNELRDEIDKRYRKQFDLSEKEIDLLKDIADKMRYKKRQPKLRDLEKKLESKRKTVEKYLKDKQGDIEPGLFNIIKNYTAELEDYENILKEDVLNKTLKTKYISNKYGPEALTYKDEVTVDNEPLPNIKGKNYFRQLIDNPNITVGDFKETISLGGSRDNIQELITLNYLQGSFNPSWKPRM